MSKIIVSVTLLVAALIGITIGLFLQVKEPKSVQLPPQKEQNVPAPTPQKKISIVGVTASFDEETSLQRFAEVADKLSIYSPGLYNISRAGQLQQLSVKHRDTFLSHARNNNLTILPLIGDGFDSSRVQLLLNNKEIQKEFIRQLVEEAKNQDFDGWALDIEVLSPQDRDAFTEFIRDVAFDLHDNGLLLKVILFAKTAQKSSYPGRAQDYAAIGQYADFLGLMFFTFHNEATGPGAQAPLSWYRDTLSFATSQIPKEKIIVGLTTHGFDWGVGRGREVTYPQAEERINTYSATVHYDQIDSSAVATYEKDGVEHVIWYEDATTIVEKMKIARDKFNLSTFAFWRIGAEDPKLWSLIPNISN